MNRFPVIHFEELPIINYLKYYGHGPDSKDYEMAIGVWIKRLYERNFKTPYCIAFELKEELTRTNPKFDLTNLSHVKDVIENGRKQDTLIDFILVKGRAYSKPETGWGFQLKRFGKNIKLNFERELVKLINSLLKENDGRGLGLIVIPEADKNSKLIEIRELEDVGLKIEKIRQQLKINTNSYDHIQFLNKVGTKILLTEIWPEQHTIEMDIHGRLIAY